MERTTTGKASEFDLSYENGIKRTTALGDSVKIHSHKDKNGRGKALDTKPIQGQKAVTSAKSDKSQLEFRRVFTEEGKKPLDRIEYVKSSAQIRNSDGSVVFEMKNVETPASWSQLATDIVVSKYFRKSGVPKVGHEFSVRQVIYRVAHTLRFAGEQAGYFSGKQADTFEDELTHVLINQIAAFNSPVWFNLGLWHEYSIKGSGGNYTWNREAKRIEQVANNYEAPQCSACFIQSVDDDLMSIFELVKNEARLFKYGSGTGTNFSKIRGRQEKLSGGGTSSGLMSFMEVFDRGAGATKSGGTTRRAAKMVCLDMDHPEIADFITWKSREEKKARALIEAGYPADFNGEAYRTVGGQNSNNSIRVSDEFMHAFEDGKKWHTRARLTGEILDTYEAKDLWKMIATAAWECADPGVQFDTTINDWNTCLESGRINASNPCSEYMFLDDSACNLSSVNLVKFLKDDGQLDIDAFRHVCRLMAISQEILVDFSSYPTERIARNSHDYRPLGLGYANLGTLLMLKGIPYDSDEGRALAAALTSIMTGHAYAVSAELAGMLGTFNGYAKNRESMLNVIKKHKDAVENIDSTSLQSGMLDAAREDWAKAFEIGTRNGYRNAQVSVLAPTGTIGLLMDCDTTGVEPDFALVKFKKLAGGGHFKIVNQSVPSALKRLGYTKNQIEDIIRYVLGDMSFEKSAHVNREFLRSKGLTDSEINQLDMKLPATFDLSSTFSRYSIGDKALKRLGVPESEFEKQDFNFLKWTGLTDVQIEEANIAICGTMTIEGAPHLDERHLAVFDCANKCGTRGARFIAPMGHVRMMASVQPFLSGAISKTVNLPHETTVEEIADIYMQAWKLGLKAVAVYRDGCKSSQPLSSKSSSKANKEENKTEQAIALSPQIQLSYVPPLRRRLPAKRRGFTQEATVGGHKVYLRTGEFDDGALGEVFIDMHKEGAAYRSMMNCFAISISLGLQYGVPLEEFVNKFTFTRFEPSGFVEGHPNVKMATSLVDYIFRVLGMEYLGRTDFLQVKPKTVDITAEKDSPQANEPLNPAQAIAFGIPIEGIQNQMEIPIKISNSQESVSDHLAEMMGDAPPCDQCGHTTIRNGACYKCLNCGNSMGCS